MAGTRKGFNRERHTPLKVAFAGLALGGFSVAWAGFAASHPSGAPEPQLSVAASAVQQVPTTTPGPATTATAAANTPATVPPATSTPTLTAAVEATATPAAPRAATSQTQRRSRGS
jgi:hypothetical protein